MLDVASKIMNGIGYTEHSSDIFYVTIGNSHPKVKKGKFEQQLEMKLIIMSETKQSEEESILLFDIL